MTELGRELLLDRSDERVVELILHEVDRTASEASAHHAGTCHLTLAGKLVEEIEFLAADLVKFAQSEMSLVHQELSEPHR